MDKYKRDILRTITATKPIPASRAHAMGYSGAPLWANRIDCELEKIEASSTVQLLKLAQLNITPKGTRIILLTLLFNKRNRYVSIEERKARSFLRGDRMLKANYFDPTMTSDPMVDPIVV